MRNKRIPAKDCREIVSKVKGILLDAKVGRAGDYSTLFGGYKEVISQIIGFGVRNGYLTEKQINYLEGINSNYERILELNWEYPGDLAEKTASVLEEVAELAENYVQNDRGVRTRKTLVKRRAQAIRDGQLFWDSYIAPAQDLLKILREHTDTSDLEKRTEEIRLRTYLGWSGNLGREFQPTNL